MCGIVFAIANTPVEAFIRAAHERQHHRGPDGGGVHLERSGDVSLGFAHERLAILDLTERGAQPMTSASGKSLIVFNGEIYNYRELAQTYGLLPLRSGTDTEVAVELIERIGIEAASRVFNGMWAIAVLNRQDGKIFLSRDRFGKKPLYYAAIPGGVAFASEMHSLLLHPDIHARPDVTVAARFLSQSVMDVDERSWVEGVRAFPASSVGYIDLTAPEAGLRGLRRYWSPPLGEECLDRRPEGLVLEELRELVADSVRLRLHADVPVGIALSGGLDSSIIAALAKGEGQQSQDVRLFSATNPGAPGDESGYVRTMAAHLGLDVAEFTLSAGSGDLLYELIRKCIWHNDGPIASFSNVLFYKLMEAAKQMGATVVLTGQGGDEVFCGYRKYPVLELKRLIRDKRILSALRLGAQVLSRGTVLGDFKFSEAKRYLGRSNSELLGEQARKVQSAIDLAAIETMSARQWLDIGHLSVPYLCHYEDRLSMAWSRETRCPFLDYRVVELGLKLPTELKLKGGWTKFPLRQTFAGMLPEQITWRRDKKGFTNPQDDWLRKDLRPFVLEAMADPKAQVYEHGLVDQGAYLSRFEQYCAGNGRIWFRDVFAPFAVETWLQSVKHMSEHGF